MRQTQQTHCLETHFCIRVRAERSLWVPKILRLVVKLPFLTFAISRLVPKKATTDRWIIRDKINELQVILHSWTLKLFSLGFTIFALLTFILIFFCCLNINKFHKVIAFLILLYFVFWTVVRYLLKVTLVTFEVIVG